MNENERFWNKVNKTNTCWLWTAGCYGRNKEYGSFYPTGSKKPIGAHIWSFKNAGNIIPEGFVIDHLCRKTKCVNPDHLEAVTQKENILRGEGLAAKQAKQTECKYGHTLSDAHILKNGARDCRQCRKIRNNRRSSNYRKVHG